MHAPAPASVAPTHTGMSYHAPGPDGQPWLHLRGPAGTPAPNWSVSADGQDGNSAATPSQDGHLPDPSAMWHDPPHFMPFQNGHTTNHHNHAHTHVAMM